MPVLIVEFYIEPNYREDFILASETNASTSLLNEAGCLRFDIVADRRDQSHFIFYEIYSDDSALEAHRASSHVARWRNTISSHLTNPQRIVEGLATAASKNSFIADGAKTPPEFPQRGQVTILPRMRMPSVDRGGGVRSVALVTTQLGTSQFLSGTTDIEAGSGLPMHSHNCEEFVTVIAGTPTFETTRLVENLVVGDATWVPTGESHRYVNRSNEVAQILWVYGRTDATRTLTGTGETFPIGSSADQRVGVFELSTNKLPTNRPRSS